MNQNKQKTIKSQLPITILSVIALVCITLSEINYFVSYTYHYVDDEWVEACVVRLPTLSLFEILFLLADLVPCVLFTLFVFKYHKKHKAKIFMPIIFGAFVFSPLLSIVESAVYCFTYDAMWYIIYLAQFIVFSLATISVLSGFSKKFFPLIALAVGLVLELFYLINFLNAVTWYIEVSRYLYLFTHLIGIIGFTSLFISLIIFILNNKVPAVFSKIENDKFNDMDYEQALIVLKSKLDSGMITEEEYQAQRAEIISKL